MCYWRRCLTSTYHLHLPPRPHPSHISDPITQSLNPSRQSIDPPIHLVHPHTQFSSIRLTSHHFSTSELDSAHIPKPNQTKPKQNLPSCLSQPQPQPQPPSPSASSSSMNLEFLEMTMTMKYVRVSHLVFSLLSSNFSLHFAHPRLLFFASGLRVV
ncbi:hypothetical protein SISSUDRAFT_66365 [Sistotremastrum suecicum HHB10207 ss-3]|uniref:Uncharacterized protein n=1 Tax=Sistotremastrum suecicum HHB10207 ss-3 TaxID=1314776 RepID=A0A166BJ83_9AGAM|nr:hypothetical protein SISSUDRAFT_66365 [Sistotremastrum suecicum HHB10207 ss-3]